MAVEDKDLLLMLAEGWGDADIAGALCVSIPYVKGYLKNMRERLGASNRAHAVAIALCKGIITLDDVRQRCEAWHRS